MWAWLEPYEQGSIGLTQFATVLLKFPEVMMRFAIDNEQDRWLGDEDGELFHGKSTQENILNEVLRVNDYETS